MNEKIVLVTGVFDVLHEEHLNFLHKAKKLGTALLVGIESDVRVKLLKGEGRPINSERVRRTHLKELAIADEVFILPEKFSSIEDHRALLAKIKPAVLAVSSHTPFIENKRKLMAEVGGTVEIVHKQNKKISTTLILQRVSNKK
ncbi:adenylyltransferase/cytidyltransferase family protein [Candidatus Woesebacteria bacterium]|nr:adenylyltransferase/cytidyltransferase family protein [Candidatus Woesebacteria bacterium]